MAKTNLSKKVLTTIKKKHIKPRPKYYFYLSSLFFGLSVAASIIFTTFFFNLFLFHLKNPRPRPLMFIHRPLPLLFIILALSGLILSVSLLKKNQYRHSLLAIFIGAFIFVILAGSLLSKFRAQKSFPQPLRRFYHYRQLPSGDSPPCHRGNCLFRP